MVSRYLVSLPEVLYTERESIVSVLSFLPAELRNRFGRSVFFYKEKTGSRGKKYVYERDYTPTLSGAQLLGIQRDTSAGWVPGIQASDQRRGDTNSEARTHGV